MSYSVHDEDDFARVYDDDDIIQIRKGDLMALLDLATGSMNFSSGFWDNEQVEVARGIASLLGIDPDEVTPLNFVCQYSGKHSWNWQGNAPYGAKGWFCGRCISWDRETPPPEGESYT